MSAGRLAVIGPFAACSSTNPSPSHLSCKGRGGCEAQCYLHSYNGFPSNTTSIYGGLAMAAPAAGFSSVSYSLGSNLTCPQVTRSGGSVGDFDCVSDSSSTFYSAAAAAAIKAAAAEASSAEVTVLVVGLGAIMESEGGE